MAPGTYVRDIPLRALIARDIPGLMMAGRCISGDFIAHSSYRVTGNAVAMGQAAGVCAALAAKNACLPQDVPWADVQRGIAQVSASAAAGAESRSR
jgi:succinate dehydrogenase/fumarate reductase flavoprotein subunit